MVGASGDQVSEEREAVGLVDAVVDPIRLNAVFRCDHKVGVDQGGAAEG